MFYKIKKKISDLCNKYDVPVPEIDRVENALKGIETSCDSISESNIYLNIEEAGDLSLIGDQQHYSAHIFCHYLCNLEQVPKHSDKVVELMVEWMAREFMDNDHGL